MGEPLFVVDVRDPKGVARKLQDIGWIFGAVHQYVVKGAAEAAQKTARRAAKPHAADQGILGRAIMLEYSNDRLVATVFPQKSLSRIASLVEHGRKPGRRPPYGPIKRWAESHGIVPIGRGNSRFVQELREDIRGRGTRGVGFMAAAAAVGESVMKDGVPKSKQEIELLWTRASI